MEKKTGAVSWRDLTVADADEISQFYAEVVGWQIEPLSMGDYKDYVMKTPSGEGVAGVCHARGVNQGLPPQWLIYITVDNLDESLNKVKELGGQVLGEKRSMGPSGFYCLVQDPAGAYVMLCG